MLDYFPNADHAGLYAAQAAGLYAQAGLDVKLQPPPDPSAPLKLLRAGRADLAISYEPELLLARDQGAETLVAVGALVQTPLTSLIALPARRACARREDLAGKRVGDGRHPLPERLPEDDPRAGGRRPGVGQGDQRRLQPRRRRCCPRRSTRRSARSGTTRASTSQRRNRKPVILRMEKLGVPTYNELILVARREALDAAGASRLRRFITATAAGHRLLRENPAAGVDALLEADKGLDRDAPGGGDRGDAAGLLPGRRREAVGLAGAGRLGQLRALDARRTSCSSGRPREAPPLTNEFLPGEGLGASCARMRYVAARPAQGA